MVNLASQARTCIVWMSGSKFNYVIPLHSGLESVLGTNLEIALDLSQSAKLHRIYSGIVKNHSVVKQAASPQTVIPLDLTLGFQRLRWKTVLTAEESSLSRQKPLVEQPYVDSTYETVSTSALLK